MDNEACLAWLAGVLRQLRVEGQTKMVGYLEEVMQEVVFELEGLPRFVAHRAEGV